MALMAEKQPSAASRVHTEESSYCVTAPHVVRERSVAMALTYSFALLPVPLKQM